MENRIEELEIKVQKLNEESKKLREKLQTIELDPQLTQKEKDREIAILRFHLQENASYRFVLEGQLKNMKDLEEYKINNAVEEVEPQEEIIPRQYIYLVNNLKSLQNNLEQRIQEETTRAKKYNTGVNEEHIKERRRILNTKIRHELAFLCSNSKTKKELEKIFKIKL